MIGYSLLYRLYRRLAVAAPTLTLNEGKIIFNFTSSKSVSQSSFSLSLAPIRKRMRNIQSHRIVRVRPSDSVRPFLSRYHSYPISFRAATAVVAAAAAAYYVFLVSQKIQMCRKIRGLGCVTRTLVHA